MVCRREGAARLGTIIERKYESRLDETVGFLVWEKKTIAGHGEQEYYGILSGLKRKFEPLSEGLPAAAGGGHQPDWKKRCAGLRE
jgi:hypothetical protein